VPRGPQVASRNSTNVDFPFLQHTSIRRAEARMDSDPIDPTSSIIKRKNGVILSDSEQEENGSPPPRKSKGRTGSKRRRTLPADSAGEEEDARERGRASNSKGRAVEEEDDQEEEEEDGENGEVNGHGVVDDGTPLQAQYRPEYERHPDGYALASLVASTDEPDMLRDPSPESSLSIS